MASSLNEGMSQLKPNNYSGMWFLLGAALPTVLLFILASDRVGEQLSSVSSWGSNNGYLPPSHPKDPAPAQQQEERPMGLGLGLGCTEGISMKLNWFLLGAALPTILLFVLASDRVGEQLYSVSSWGNGGGTRGAQEHEEKFPGLAKLLPKVAMEDRTVIITTVNEAWARPNSLLDIYLESFKNGEDTEHLLDHLLIIALDPAGFRRCVAVHPHCYLLEVKTVNLTSATPFLSKEYIELVWTKLSLQQHILELGYNFLYTDTDMILLRNPFRRIAVYADMSVSCDRFSATRAPLENPLNTGFYYMKATNRSVEMLRYWQAARPRFPGVNDQPVFTSIMHELVEKLKVRIEPLDTTYFSTFCEYHNDLGSVCTMHAACCKGLDNKVQDLMGMAADWKRYMGLVPEERKKMNGNLTWTRPVRCYNSMGWN